MSKKALLKAKTCRVCGKNLCPKNESGLCSYHYHLKYVQVKKFKKGVKNNGKK